MTLTTPVPEVVPVTGERMDVLDAVRGVAVLGILFVNIESLSGWGFISPEERASMPLAGWDDQVMFLIRVLIEGKFYALFSLLFGVGFAVFVNRAQMRGADAGRLFKRRLGGLLLIGLIHTLLIWFGDILVTYAILGFGLLPFLRKDDRTLLRWAAILLLLPAVLYLAAAAVALAIATDQAPVPGGPLPPILATAVDAFARGNYVQIVEANATWTVANVLRRIGLMFFPRVFAMFLIGLYIGRRGLLVHVSEHRGLLRRVALWGAVVGLPLSLLGHVVADRLGVVGAIAVEGVANSIAIPTLTLAYGAGLCLLFARSRALMHAFAAPGRMALSNYLLQSVAGVIAFYGIGFGWFGGLSLASALAVAVAFFAVQMILSRLWLERAAFGPAEWLWRMFTYRRRFPLVRGAVA